MGLETETGFCCWWWWWWKVIQEAVTESGGYTRSKARRMGYIKEKWQRKIAYDLV
jgi:hypothetical protein